MLLQLRPEDSKKGVDIKDAANQTSLCSKFVKADFSGAKVLVVLAKNEHLVGM